jgi:transcriptional regulator
MHPNAAFAWTDTDAMLAFAADRGFSVIACVIDGLPRTAHAPVIVLRDPARLQFHLAVRNLLAKEIDSKPVTIIVTAHDGYISPDWYVGDNQVPTWNYLAVEVSGMTRKLSTSELVAQLDLLSATHEQKIDTKTPWTRAKMTTQSFEAMLNSIVGFEVSIDTMRGTAKLSQNKKRDDFDGAVNGLRPHAPELADLMAQWRQQK